MILVFQKYHFNFTAGDAKLCWISIFTFSSRFLFILFLCFFGELLPSAFYAPCPWLGQFLFVKKQKWASCSLAPTAVPCATWLPFLCYSYLSSSSSHSPPLCAPRFACYLHKILSTWKQVRVHFTPKHLLLLSLILLPRLHSEFHVHIFSQIQWNFCCLRLKFKFYYARRIKWNEKWKTRSTKKSRKTKAQNKNENFAIISCRVQVQN